MTRSASISFLAALLACGTRSGVEAGRETGPCSQGECFPGLACLSDLCVDPNWEPTGSAADSTSQGESDDEDSAAETGPVGNPSAVDILFVIDDSGSMGTAQEGLALAAADFAGALEGLGADYRIGVTTTDVGNVWCEGAGIGGPENGELIRSSCRIRLNDFYFAGDDVDASDACTNYCPQGADFRLQPRWIDSAGDGNLPAGLDLASTLQCLLPQGVIGCGFEGHLRAAYETVARSADASDNAFGFIREDAHLMIVIVSDEADCSADPAWDTIFREYGNQVFWSLPDEQQSPTSAVCWNAGVACSPEGAGTYDACVPQDKDFMGNPTDDPSAAVLYSLSHYQALLDELAASKVGTGGKSSSSASSASHPATRRNRSSTRAAQMRTTRPPSRRGSGSRRVAPPPSHKPCRPRGCAITSKTTARRVRRGCTPCAPPITGRP